MENNELGAKTPAEGTDTQDKSVDYEKEFKALTDKYNSLNNDYMKKSDAYDKVSSENADYKRKEREKMTDEEKKAKEFQELIDSRKKMEAELQQMKLEKEILSNGFTTEECAKLQQTGLPLESIKVIADIVKDRIDANTKSIRAEGIKNSTNNPMSNATDGSKPVSDFAKYQKEKQDRIVTGEVKL